jgi:hypothetical protein
MLSMCSKIRELFIYSAMAKRDGYTANLPQVVAKIKVCQKQAYIIATNRIRHAKNHIITYLLTHTVLLSSDYILLDKCTLQQRHILTLQCLDLMPLDTRNLENG